MAPSGNECRAAPDRVYARPNPFPLYCHPRTALCLAPTILPRSTDPITIPRPNRRAPPVLQVVIEAEPGPDIMDALRGRLDRLGCGFPEVSDTADGGLSVSGLLSGLPSRELVPVACRLLGVAGVRRVQASFLSPDGTVLAEVTLSG